MLVDMWKEARKLDISKTVDEKITVCIQENVVDFESSGALSTSDKTQLHLALITYKYRSGACYDVETINFTVHAAVQAIVQTDNQLPNRMSSKLTQKQVAHSKQLTIKTLVID